MTTVENSTNNSENKSGIFSKEWTINYILDTLKGQAQVGGYSSPNKENKKSNGHFCPRKNWADFCERVKKQLTENDYPEEKTKQAIEEATAKVEFFD